MKYYGLNRADLHRLILKQIQQEHPDRYLVVPTEGKFVSKQNEIVYEVVLAGKKAELMMSQSCSGASLEELNGQYCVQSIVKKEGHCDLLISIGDTVEEATTGLEEQIVEHYLRHFKLNSKEKLKKLLAN